MSDLCGTLVGGKFPGSCTRKLGHGGKQHYSAEGEAYNQSKRERDNSVVVQWQKRKRAEGYYDREASVYAVWFPADGLLKVGFTTSRWNWISNAKSQARKLYDSAGDGHGIWIYPGDRRYEAFIQATLSFRYSQPSCKASRMSEWFLVRDTPEDALKRQLTVAMERAVELDNQ